MLLRPLGSGRFGVSARNRGVSGVRVAPRNYTTRRFSAEPIPTLTLNKPETLAFAYLEKRLPAPAAHEEAKSYIAGVVGLLRSGEWMRDLKHDTTKWLAIAPSRTVVNLLHKHPHPAVREYFASIDVYHIPYAKLFKATETLSWPLVSAMALEVMEFAALTYLQSKDPKRSVPEVHQESKTLISEDDFIAAIDAMVPEVFAKTPLTEIFINARIRYGAVCPVMLTRKVTAAKYSSGEILVRALRSHPSKKVRDHFAALRLYHVAGGEREKVFADLPHDLAVSAAFNLGRLSPAKLYRACHYLSGRHESFHTSGASTFFRTLDVGFGFKIADVRKDEVRLLYDGISKLLNEMSVAKKLPFPIPQPPENPDRAAIQTWFSEVREALLVLPEVAAFDLQRDVRSLWRSVLSLYRKRYRSGFDPARAAVEKMPFETSKNDIFQCSDEDFRSLSVGLACGLQVIDKDGTLLEGCVEDFFRTDLGYWEPQGKMPQRGFELRKKRRDVHGRVGDLVERFYPLTEAVVESVKKQFKLNGYDREMRAAGNRALGEAFYMLNAVEELDFPSALKRYVHRAVLSACLRLSSGMPIASELLTDQALQFAPQIGSPELLAQAVDASRAISAIAGLQIKGRLLWAMIFQHLRDNPNDGILTHLAAPLPPQIQPVEEALKRQAGEAGRILGIAKVEDIQPVLKRCLDCPAEQWPEMQQDMARFMERLDLRLFLLDRIIAVLPTLPVRTDALRRSHDAQFEEVFTTQKGLVGFVFKKVANLIDAQSDIEDILQEGNMALDRAIRGFDLYSGYRFSTYATIAIRRAMLNKIYEMRDAAKHIEFDETWGMEQAADSKSGTAGLKDALMKAFWKFLERHPHMFDDREHEILCLRFERHMNYDQIGKVFGVTGSRIGDIVRSAMHMVQLYLEAHPDEREEYFR